VIVRISTDRQYRLPDEDKDRLNELDNEATAAVEAGDEDRFHEAFESLLELVRSEGSPLDGDDDLEASDVIIPPPDLSFVEAGEHFTGDGLIPD
jgi:PspA-Associated protein